MWGDEKAENFENWLSYPVDSSPCSYNLQWVAEKWGQKLKVVICYECQTDINPLGFERIIVAELNSYPGNIKGLENFKCQTQEVHFNLLVQ